MKSVVLYRPKSDHASAVESFIHDFRRRHEQARLEVLDLNSREGSAMATLYDIMSYPAIMCLRNDGSVLQVWQGTVLPLLDEVAAYTLDRS